MRFQNAIDTYLQNCKATIDRLDRAAIDTVAGLILDAYHDKRQIFVFGNGGSASTASHFACDLNKGACQHARNRFKVICLNDNLPTLMAYANDVSYADIFSEQLKNFVQPGDLVIGFSGSGNSPNVLNAIDYANQQNAITIGITGYDGGKLARSARHAVNANVNDMQLSEDVHIILVHLLMRTLMEAIAAAECPGEAL